jgi:hypothetical protein
MTGLGTPPSLKNVFSTDAFLMGFLFVLMTMPSALRVTGGFVSGSMQLFIHGLVLWWIFLWFSQALPTGAGHTFGLNSGPLISPLT